MKNKIEYLISLLLVISLLFSSCISLDILPTDFSDVSLKYENDEKRYYYNNLTENGKIAYTLILNSIVTHPEKIEIPSLTEDEFSAVFYAISYDNPDLLCIGKTSEIHSEGMKYYYIPDYSMDAATCDSMMQKLDIAVDKFISSVPAEASDYEKELLVHDYICDNCTYVYNGEENIKASSYDAIINGEAVCEGYARAAQLLLNRLNIKNYLICGEATDSENNTESHMWNIVTIGGKNYHMDLTWDDFDKTSELVSHSYFNVTDVAISSNHFKFSPANNNCVSDESNYFVVNNLVFSEYSKSVDSKLISMSAKNISNGDFSVEIQFLNVDALNKAQKNLVDESKIYNLLETINKKSTKKFSNIKYSVDENMLTLQFTYE